MGKKIDDMLRKAGYTIESSKDGQVTWKDKYGRIWTQADLEKLMRRIDNYEKELRGGLE